MRLGDLDALREDWLENGENEYVYDTNSFLSSIDDQPTIDPETLPIVQQLRAELERVTAEKDAAVDDLRISAYCKVCKTRCSVTEALSRRSNGSCRYFEWRGAQKEE